MTGQFTEVDHPRGEAGRFVEKTAADPGSNVLAPTGTANHIAQVCTEAGLPMMAGVLQVVTDRGYVYPETLDNLTASDVERLYSDHIGPAVDDVETAVETRRDGGSSASEPAQVRDHLSAICEEAGLPVMVGFFDVVVDRGDATGQQLLTLTSSDVAAMYDGIVGPAIDHVDDDLIEGACRACGASLDDGEGSEGFCGDCADARSCAECGDHISDDLDDIEDDHLCPECRRDAN